MIESATGNGEENSGRYTHARMSDKKNHRQEDDGDDMEKGELQEKNTDKSGKEDEFRPILQLLFSGLT